MILLKRKKGIIVGVQLKQVEDSFNNAMEELKGLAMACHLEVVGVLTQKLQRIHQAHYLGAGKMEELIELVSQTEADVVIFNDELSPSQIKVLEEKLEVEVIDRSMLILDIFAERARTREAQLQVEVARLEYMLPRLVGQGEHLSRQGGRAGLKNRGAGETKLELDRRKIEEKIASLSRELELIVGQRQTQRRRRQKDAIPVVSLVGYTNAGKSTIMNAMVDLYHPREDKRVFEKDMLFATLETSVRHIKLEDNKAFLLTDTVGFISKLPHHLIKAFRSTLEEVVEADLIIHVVDASDPHYGTFINVTQQTLQDIGVKDVPMIYAFNKCDLANEKFPRVEGNKVFLSAKQQLGMSELIKLIKQHIFKDYVQHEVLIPYDQGHIVAYLNEHAHVIETTYEEAGTKLKVEWKKSDMEKYQDYIVS